MVGVKSWNIHKKEVFMLSLMVEKLGPGFYNWMIGILNIFFIVG